MSMKQEGKLYKEITEAVDGVRGGYISEVLNEAKRGFPDLEVTEEMLKQSEEKLTAEQCIRIDVYKWFREWFGK